MTPEFEALTTRLFQIDTAMAQARRNGESEEPLLRLRRETVLQMRDLRRAAWGD